MIIALQALLIFRNSVVTIINRYLSPYFTNLLIFENSHIDDEDNEDEVFAEFDDEKGVVFYPPVYAQRYAAVSDCILDKRWCGKLEKIVDFGCHDMSFIKYLKDVPGVKEIFGVDLETIPLNCSSEMRCDKYMPKRETPLKITLFQGNAADPDFRLVGCDAVIATETIEHMQPHDLDRFIHNVFGFIKPWVVIITTPNGDFNPLFKSLEKNGLRRLDHMFEWTRGQFHDWCSNIVARYPQYNVSCKGIGPGPPGTTNLGCCSQLALFVAKNYQKQTDLNYNSLALVTRVSTSDSLSDVADSWDSLEPATKKDMLCAPNSARSLTDLISENQSRLTFVISTPSDRSIECENKTLQCNLDTEFEKNFVMFDDEMLYNIVTPRRRLGYRVYDIEDVSNRLNCTNIHVKKFSKATHNLMAKNKMDALVHTREVVDEIRHLSKILDFNKSGSGRHGERHIWCNINWGENAPYWNQYYKVVREYTYPFEVKSKESRILELISENINRLVDSCSENEMTKGGNKVEIPMEYLMLVVSDLTDDVNQVRELLEWDGYDVVDDKVVYSRLVVDDISDEGDDCRQIDNISDCFTDDGQSTTFTDDITIDPDLCDRGLRRALDRKIRNLRRLNKNEDITTELDRVVCRLVRLALGACRGMASAPPSAWLLHKLYDLLTMTENAILRRKTCCFDSPLKAIEYTCDKENEKNFSGVMSADTVTKKILEKYQLLSSTDSDNIIEYFSEQDNSANSKFVNTSRISKSKFDDYEAFGAEAGLTGHEMDRLKVKLKECEGSETSYVNDVCPYPSLTALQSTAPVDDDSGVQNNLSTGTLIQSQDVNVNNRSEIRIKATREKLKEKTVTNLKISKSRVTKSMILKKNTFLKQRSIRNCKFQDKKETYENVTALRGDSARMLWQPIPDSLMQLRQSSGRENKERTQPSLCVIDGMTSATEESTFLNIITVDGQEETIAFHRSVGTDPEIHDVKEAAEERVLNVTQDERLTSRYVMSDEKANSSTFLHDIDEPSTSEGVRNYSTDVQCGPDVFCDHITLSVTTSTVKISKRHTTGIRIEDSDTDVPIINRLDYYADTKMIANKCSDANSVGHSESNCTVTYSDNKYETNPSEMSSSLQQNPLVTELIKPSFSLDKAKDSCSVRVCDSTSSFLKFPENESRLKSQSELDNDISRHSSPLHYLKSKLSYGGIYVHSFKDKRMAEDIVYQGDWQKNISNRKVFARKNPSRSYVKRNEIHKKRYDANNKKNVHIAPRSTDEETASNPKKVNILKKSHLHSFKNTDAPLKKKTVKFVRPVDKAKYSKRSKSVTKVASKIITSVVNYKNNTPAISSIKPLQTSTPIKCPTSIERKVINVNNYIPTYLKKKRLPKFTKNNIKHLNDGLSSLLFNDKTCGLISHDQKEIRQETYPFRNEKNITYFVYRNEIDPENVLSCVEPGCAANYGSSSIHKTSISNISSPCSSPNSLVTVRNVTLPNQIDYGNIISTSSDKSISESYDLDTNVSKTKKILRKCKIKKTNMTLDVQDNKENITESSRNSCALPKAIKKPFLGTNKTVYLTHMSTETVPNTHQIVCRKKWPTPVLIKPTPTNIENKLSNICKKVSTDIAMTSTDVASSMQKKELLFSDLNHLKGNKAKEDLGQTCLKEGGMQCIEFYIKSIIEEKINNIDHFITNSHGSTVDITPSEINVEKNNSGYGILNNDAQDLNLQKRMSAISSTLNKTSSIELKQVRSIVTDTDLLSFKSFASSKISEYFLADNDLEEDFFLQLNNSTSSLFQDIIDNCKQNRSQQQVQSTNNLNNSKTAVHKRLDYVNSVDSETGSRTFTVSKRVTSEELFASNGSTETYESCAVEEDVLVPEWLFEVDSGQEEDPSGLSVPGDQEELGLNGNVSEPSAVVGAGAGDGRGMHSDLSQESSGRGTSLSSSGTSSGQESQGVLSDLSESTVPNGSIQESRESAASNAPHEPLPDNRVVLPTSRAEPAGILTIPVRTASDGHVDVTSLIPGGLQLNN